MHIYTYCIFILIVYLYTHCIFINKMYILIKNNAYKINHMPISEYNTICSIRYRIR